MREIAVDFLREEVLRLRSVVAHTRVFHPSGQKLHVSGDAIGAGHVKSMAELGIRTLYLLEPGEDEIQAQKSLAVEKVEVRDLVEGDMLLEDLRGADGSVLAASGAS